MRPSAGAHPQKAPFLQRGFVQLVAEALRAALEKRFVETGSAARLHIDRCLAAQRQQGLGTGRLRVHEGLFEALVVDWAATYA